MLEALDLKLRQGTFNLAATFTIPAAARVALIGPSGAGKSTLLTAIAGFLAPNAGTLTWNGKALTDLGPAVRPIAMLFQDNNLFTHMTAAQNVGLGIRPTLRLTPKEDQRVAQALARVGLGDMGSRKPAQLSGGQQSRVALARVLVQRRPVLLLDEPFAALGPALKQDMLGLVEALCEDMGTTLLMVTHDPKDADRLCPNTLIVSSGKVSKLLETQAVLRDPPEDLKAYLG